MKLNKKQRFVERPGYASNALIGHIIVKPISVHQFCRGGWVDNIIRIIYYSQFSPNLNSHIIIWGIIT